MLPTAPGSFAGYRLLTEFFTLPQKFLFLEVSGMDRWQGDDVELYIYLDSSDARLERMISASDIVLNATPVINLFRQSSEPLTLDGSRTEYSLLPDSRRQTTREIYMVEQVRLSAASGEEQDARPFFGSSQRGANSSVFWQAVRRFDEDDGSSDTQIAFVDRNRGPLEPTGLTASVDTLCLNRDLASQLPFGGGHPHLQLVKRSESVAEIKALLPPTPAIRIHENWRASGGWSPIFCSIICHCSTMTVRH